MNYGIDDDVTLAAALLHDLLEDCSDRLHNSTSLYTFTFDRMRKYIEETNDFLLPMASYCKNYYPDYTNSFSILKSNIYSLNNSMRIMMEKFDQSENFIAKEAHTKGVQEG